MDSLSSQPPVPDFREFDIVTVINHANVQWLYTDPSDLGGEWAVSSITDKELVLVSGERLIRIPKRDVQKVSAYSTDALLDYLKRNTGYG